MTQVPLGNLTPGQRQAAVQPGVAAANECGGGRELGLLPTLG